MLSALAHHLFLLAAFKHDGKNLPQSSGLPIALLAIATLTMVLRAINAGNPVSGACLTAAIGAGILYFCARDRPPLLAAVALISIAGDMLIIAASSIDELRMTLMVWQITAFYFAMKKIRASEHGT